MQLGFCDMAETITTAAINNDEDFPFVRVKLFEVPAKQIRELTGVEMFSWNPFVTEVQREAWYNFTQAEKGWYEESKEIVISPLNESEMRIVDKQFEWRKIGERFTVHVV